MVAYVVLTRERVRDHKGLEMYSSKVAATFAGHAVTARVVFGRHEILEGAEVDGMAILEFPTFELAKAWYNSPAYQEAAAYRFKAADFRCMIIEGLRSGSRLDTGA